MVRLRAFIRGFSPPAAPRRKIIISSGQTSSYTIFQTIGFIFPGSYIYKNCENAMTTESHDLQLANGRIASLEQEALTHGEEVRSAEARAKAAEDKATDDATLL